MVATGERKRWILATENMKPGDVLKNSMHLAETPGTSQLIITARKQSLRRLCFYTCLSVILFTGGGVCLSACWDKPPHPGTRPPPQSRHPLEQTPPEQCMLGDTGNKRAVHILLECILVY